jgi:LysR family transcriptional regulator for bpeEF and oprC
MQVFTRVVDSGNFTRAADSLGLPRATVTTSVQNLERHLRVRLLNRTTRRISLTQDGAAYYDRCKSILDDVDEAESALRDAARNPKGRLRIDTVPSIGRLVLIPALTDFCRRYPDIEVVIGMSSRPVDLVAEGVDCVIRIGELPDSSLIARRLGTVRSITCASADYLDRYGEPRTLEQLQDHHAVSWFSSTSGRNLDWSFVVDGAVRDIKMNSKVSVNDADAYMECALQGLGLVQPPLCLARPYLDSGQLREILPQWLPPTMPISALYLHNRHLSAKVRVFVDWVAELFENGPELRLSDDDAEFCGAYLSENAESSPCTVRGMFEQHNKAECECVY